MFIDLHGGRRRRWRRKYKPTTAPDPSRGVVVDRARHPRSRPGARRPPRRLPRLPRARRVRVQAVVPRRGTRRIPSPLPSRACAPHPGPLPKPTGLRTVAGSGRHPHQPVVVTLDFVPRISGTWRIADSAATASSSSETRTGRYHGAAGRWTLTSSCDAAVRGNQRAGPPEPYQLQRHRRRAQGPRIPGQRPRLVTMS